MGKQKDDFVCTAKVLTNRQRKEAQTYFTDYNIRLETTIYSFSYVEGKAVEAMQVVWSTPYTVKPH